MTTPELQDQMKQAMGRLGASVTVITSHDGTRKYAMTATAVTSLTLDPPALLICVNQENGLHHALSKGHSFCVNILFGDQQDISNTCAGGEKGENKFNLGDWQQSEDNIPYLAGAQASIFCDLDDTHVYGSHSIFIGKVKKIITRDDISPLMFLAGNYFSPHP
ncbi:MAG: flavin reductase domain-containing protein [Alphaproteobacteria bacterium]|nr:MAG: flavin reductase domain-containing protein [Alphaproteobacteria bacterium]